jgi:arylsulfatase A-like enzyme
MRRRDFLKAVGVGAASVMLPRCLTASEQCFPERGKNRPNILFLLTDDQRWDMMGCAGHPILHTPNMDKIARGGVRFTNAFVTTSICAASRASIFTGVVERTHGFTFGTPPVPERYTNESYPVLLRSAGYRTGFVGKFGVNMGKDAPNRMFDFFRPLNRNPYFKKQKDGTVRHLTDLTGEVAVDFLRSCRKDQPFCLSVSFNAPHAEDSDPRQYIWPESVGRLYKEVTIPEPKLANPEFFDAQPEFIRESLNRIRWHWRFDTPEKYQRMVKGYCRMISGVDAVIGRLWSELKKLAMDENTVVLLTSDNGYFLGDRGFAGKWLPYEDSLRVPLIVYDPRPDMSVPGCEPNQMALNIDLAPTLLDLAGVSIPSTVQGQSLVPIVQGKHPAWREDFFFEHLFEHPQIPKCEGVRTSRWKYIRYFEQRPVHEELYDLKNDELEARSLLGVAEHNPVLDQLRKRCDQLRDRHGGVYRPREKASNS